MINHLIIGKKMLYYLIKFFFYKIYHFSEVSSRRLSIDSQTPICDAAMNLSILGNSIAPEEKPRVPTMSERDLTRNLNSYFIRNRSQV